MSRAIAIATASSAEDIEIIQTRTHALAYLGARSNPGFDGSYKAYVDTENGRLKLQLQPSRAGRPMLLTFETLKTVIGTEPDEEGFKTITEERETVLEAEFADLSDGGLIVVRNYVPGNWREILYEEARQYLRLGSHRPSCALS